jgi:hypothetical protein
VFELHPKTGYINNLLLGDPDAFLDSLLVTPVKDFGMHNKVPTLAQRLRSATAILIKGQKQPSKGVQRQALDIPVITAEEVAEARLFFPMDKFFIYGHARSGTTLLTRLVRVHPEVYCSYQAHFFTRQPLLQSLVADPQVSEWLARRSNRWNHGRDLSPVVLRAAADFIMERDARRAGKRITGDKSPDSLLDGLAVHLLVRVYPDARLVFIVRDGRDAALSHRFQAFIDTPQSLSKEDLRIRQDFAASPEPYLKGERTIFTEKGLRQAAQGWVKNVLETDQAARELLPAAYHSLRYEDLLKDPHTEMNALWAFLGADLSMPGLAEALDRELLQNPDADWQQQKASDIASALKKGKAGSWQNLFTARDRQLFWELAGTTLQAWGYEK